MKYIEVSVDLCFRFLSILSFKTQSKQTNKQTKQIVQNNFQLNYTFWVMVGKQLQNKFPTVAKQFNFLISPNGVAHHWIVMKNGNQNLTYPL